MKLALLQRTVMQMKRLTITAANDWTNISELNCTINGVVSDIMHWTVQNRLNRLIINQSKTKSIVFATKRLMAKMQAAVTDPIDVVIPGSDVPMKQIQIAKIARSDIGLVKKLSKKIGLMKRIKVYLPYIYEEKLSYYGSSVWSLCSQSNQDEVLYTDAN